MCLITWTNVSGSFLKPSHQQCPANWKKKKKRKKEEENCLISCDKILFDYVPKLVWH